MKNSNDGPTPNEMEEMVKTILSLRDALMEASLTLQDYQFHLDATSRQTARVLASALLERSRIGSN